MLLNIMQPFSFTPSSALDAKTPLLSPTLASVANSKSPEASPVNALPVLFAPFMPGASPIIASRACGSPQAGTGLFHQSGCFSCISRRNARKRGQRLQSGGGSLDAKGISLCITIR